MQMAQPTPGNTRNHRLDGIWLGHLGAEGDSLRIQLFISTDPLGQLAVSLDSIDQRAAGLACANVSFDNDAFSFDVPAAGGKWTGTLSADNNRLTGRWFQFKNFPLEFERQEQATPIPPPPTRRVLPALPPIPASEVSAQLAHDFGDIVTTGWLAPESRGGIAVGISQNGVRSIATFGAAKIDSIFEIGSISKTFTGLLLAQMAAQGEVELDEPVRRLLPLQAATTPASQEISLVDLSTHHSGLPRLPTNMHPANPEDPYADYDAQKLLAFIDSHGLTKPDKPAFNYSNLGAGLLGYALAHRASQPFFALLDERILSPLGLTDTAIALGEEQQTRFMQGHRANGMATMPWHLGAIAGAGGLRASVTDLLSYLEAFCNPEGQRSKSQSDRPSLSTALENAQKPREEIREVGRICLGWLYRRDEHTHWHTGGTGGFTSYAAFNRQSGRAIVVLANAGGRIDGSPAEAIGHYVADRLDGKPALWPGSTLPAQHAG
ncbi:MULTISPECIES: serine hydrolase domain-containing protein [unclassified Paraburkholderia]|uniref:serine hydrolase domain-containing protein n=1 Tax=unclassified Paraburkholderia TaxID=2615204 RepID=UPI002AB0680C|nr:MULTISPECIES: serine hydrolase domain-containing protein [unclassified Paraburkholderia]